MPTISRLLWNVRRFSGSIGAAGIAAILVFALTGILGLTCLRSVQDGLAAEKRAVEELQSPVPPRVARHPVSSEQLAAFYETFPVRVAAPDAMEKLYAAAASQHVDLEHGEYRMVREKGEYLSRYEIALPVKGRYTDIRKFIAQSMSEIPTLALNSISFSRQRVDDPTVDAELKFTLFLGNK